MKRRADSLNDPLPSFPRAVLSEFCSTHARVREKSERAIAMTDSSVQNRIFRVRYIAASVIFDLAMIDSIGFIPYSVIG